MIGGTIIDLVKVNDRRWWINCVGHDSEQNETCAIYIDPRDTHEPPPRKPLPIEVGDELWWQGPFAFWTTADRSRVHVRVVRLSFSGVRHPDALDRGDQAPKYLGFLEEMRRSVGRDRDAEESDCA